MTASTDDPTAVRCRCSFCGKADTEVNKVVAGPGVYICDECVGLCSAVLEQEKVTPSPVHWPAWETMTDQQMLDHLGRIVATAEQVDRGLDAWIGELRARKVTWTRIGAALGISRQSAWERFSGEQ